MSNNLFEESALVFNKIENTIKTIQQGIIAYDIRFEQKTAGRQENVVLKTQVHKVMQFEIMYKNKLRDIEKADMDMKLKEALLTHLKNMPKKVNDYWVNASKLLDHIANPHVAKEYFDLNTKYYEDYIQTNHKLMLLIGTHLASKKAA
jgi:hypothetical protein